MKILIYGINFSPELTGIGKYTGEMADWFAAKNHDVRVITAPPYYPEWKVRAGFNGKRWVGSYEGGVRVFRCPLYVPAGPKALSRIIHLTSFALSSFFSVIKQASWKPDIILLIAPTLFCVPNALLLSKICGAIKIVHVQDFEVDALFGLGISKSRLLQRFAIFLERKLLCSFDLISTISEGMLKRASSKGVPSDRLVLFPNWSELHRFRGLEKNSNILTTLGVPEHKTVLLYSGNIGEKQGLEILIEAAELLRANAQLVFLIVGEGAGKQRLVMQASEKRLGNIVFAPLQTYADFPSLLASVDVHLIIQKRGAADAVLPSKLTNILAVGGNAIISADRDTSLGSLCIENPGIAVLVEPESVQALLKGIQTAIFRTSPNQTAVNYALNNLDKDRILYSFSNKLAESLSRKGSPNAK